MNAKYALALIISLQVSMCLCQLPTPSADLSQKYDGLKATFYKRLITALNKFQLAATPISDKMADNPQAAAAREYIEALQTKPEFQALVKVVTNMGQEAGPIADNIRSVVLGTYERYFRSYAGTTLDEGINGLKVILDKYLPTE